MKKVVFKVNNENTLKFVEVLLSINAKPILSQAREGFLESVTLVWVVADEEQIKAFENNGFKPEKTF